MRNDRIVFDWTVAPDGYRWVEAVDAKDPGLLLRAIVELGSAGRPPRIPEPSPALFRMFAVLEPNEDSIKDFAEVYGNLDQTELFIAEGEGFAPGANLWLGTSLETWKARIAEAFRLVSLWDLIQNGDAKSLAPCVERRRGGESAPGVYFSFPCNTEKSKKRGAGLSKDAVLLASGTEQPELCERLDSDDPIVPAWHYLQHELNRHIAENTVKNSLAWDTVRERPTLRLVAPTLFAAVLFQLADAVTNNRTFNQCEVCGIWLEIAPDQARANQRFCSNKCRTKAYRERQDQARQLRVKGKTFEKIAEILDSDVKTVKRWITGIKE